MFSKILRINVVTLLLVFLASAVLAQEKVEFTAEEPVLITSAGQSADVLMIKILADKAGVSYRFDKNAQTALVDSVKSIIIVSGGSSKGLGAASIDKEEELQRVQDIVVKAKKAKVPVIGVHVGGKSRRGDLSDYFNKPVAMNADHLIVVKEGDDDGFFSSVAEENKILIQLPEKINDIQPILKTIYGKSDD
ncbi:MAG: hypothetical protein EH225_03010 [Calditrichaeota bacterium]|nr:hypothetical protein [Calditrichota bacterium]RQW06613.1 MAG: hypothetical protein EH225_03010 [Calditrichota bacterium]